MTDAVMKYGARRGRMNFARQLIAKATSGAVCIFPVPGTDVLRAYNKNNETEFKLVCSPREANVLLVMGELTEKLAKKAAIAYPQIPRPRVLVFAGAAHLPPLPEPDVQISLQDDFLQDAFPEIQKLLQNYAWQEHAEPWEPDFLKDIVEDDDDNKGGHDHHHHHKHGDGGNSDDGNEENEHDSLDHGDEHHEENHSDDDEDDDMDMDFMSMVMMTKDLPRPKDGLPMNRSETHFGPFHPGLPGGLSIFTELDGDTVIKAHVEHDLFARSPGEYLPLEARALPDLLAKLNPLTPQTYRLLARKALADTLSDHQEISFTLNELILLENERIGSHLNWLATFAKTIGNEWMHQKAVRWHAHHRKKEEADAASMNKFLNRIRKMPYLKNKLTNGNAIPVNLLHHVSGPVARAAGKRKDARLQNELYGELGWKPSIKQENNAWGRLEVRLDEIEQSLRLIKKIKKKQANDRDFKIPESGHGAAQIESPRGSLSLQITIQDGMVRGLQLETPSEVLAGLVNAVAEESELSDALVQIASLDISPWEMEFKNAELK